MPIGLVKLKVLALRSAVGLAVAVGRGSLALQVAHWRHHGGRHHSATVQGRLVVVVLQVTAQGPRVAVTLVTVVKLAFERLFAAVGHHVAVPGRRKTKKERFGIRVGKNKLVLYLTDKVCAIRLKC